MGEGIWEGIVKLGVLKVNEVTAMPAWCCFCCYTLVAPFTKMTVSAPIGCWRSERQLLDAAGADRGYDIATAYPGAGNFCHRPRHQSRATKI